MIKYGLKLRSSNTNLFDKASRVICNELFDFIELYIVPDEIQINTLKLLKPYAVNIHATQGTHGFNPIDLDSKAEELRDNGISKYIEYFNPKHIVMHPEHGDDINILKRRLHYFNKKNVIIENMPKYPIKGYAFTFFGYTIQQLEQIKKLGYGMCLDFEKAVKSALAQQIDYKEFISEIIKEFDPTYFHISGCDLTTTKDQHLNLREAEFDIKRVKDKFIEMGDKKDIFLVLETPRTGKDFVNDIKNLQYLKNL